MRISVLLVISFAPALVSALATLDAVFHAEQVLPEFGCFSRIFLNPEPRSLNPLFLC